MQAAIKPAENKEVKKAVETKVLETKAVKKTAKTEPVHLIKKMIVVTGEPGSGKTECHKLQIKMMMKSCGSSAYVIDAHGAVFPNAKNYRGGYGNLIAEYGGSVFKASEALSHPDFLQENTVLGVDASGIDRGYPGKRRPEFVLEIAKYLHQVATKDKRHIFLVIEEAQHFDLFNKQKKHLKTLMKLVGAHFSIALNTPIIQPITLGLGIRKSRFDLISLGRRKPQDGYCETEIPFSSLLSEVYPEKWKDIVGDISYNSERRIQP